MILQAMAAPSFLRVPIPARKVIQNGHSETDFVVSRKIPGLDRGKLVQTYKNQIVQLPGRRRDGRIEAADGGGWL